MTLRPPTDADLPRMTELLNLGRSDPFTPETLREMRSHFPSDGTRLELLAEDGAGIVRCLGQSIRWPHDPSSRRKSHVATDPAFRRLGYGSAMLDALREEGVAEVRAHVRDDDAASLRFAEARGFEVKERLFESTLDLGAFGFGPYQDDLRRAKATGVRFFPYAETAMDEAALRRHWSVNMDLSRDVPGADPEVPSFEEWREMTGKAKWFDPAGQFLAAVGDEWIGIGAVGAFEPGRYYNLFTGVRPAHRGKGIAKALKLLGILHAKASGGLTLRTNNHSENAPMLAVNRRLGYVPEPGWLTLRRGLTLS